MATQKKGADVGIVVGVAAGVAAIAAAGYFLFGPNGKNNRKVIKGWTVKMKGEVLEKIEKQDDGRWSFHYTDENGNTYTALNDDTHHLGHTLEQHDLQDADGNTVTVTETTNGDYYFQDENGTGFTDNGDGTWSDENGNSYTEID